MARLDCGAEFFDKTLFFGVQLIGGRLLFSFYKNNEPQLDILTGIRGRLQSALNYGLGFLWLSIQDGHCI